MRDFSRSESGLILPAQAQSPRIVEAIFQNQATVIVGETGSGKTSIIPPLLVKEGFAQRGQIGVMQPRKIAAISVTERVAEQNGWKMGEEVGYQIRFDDITSARTKLKFMTDGILLQEAKSDPLFSRYDVLIFDEAHERGLNNDFGLGLARRALEKRKDLRVVVMSATIDTEKFSRFFMDAPVIDIDGKMFPVEERFLEEGEEQAALEMFGTQDDEEFWYRRRQDEVGAIEALAAYKVNQIHSSDMPGDVLIFMPTTHLIRKTMELLERLGYPDLHPLAVSGDMSPDDQRRIFQRFPGRKVVVATNIAETSITIDGIVHVIDSGLINQKEFDPRRGIDVLEVIEHSRAGLKQRAGRAGRTQPGIAWRLFTQEENDKGRYKYSKYDYETGQQEKRPDSTKPEMLREDLSGVVLRMIGMGISDIENFPFVDNPDKEQLDHAVASLKALGAIDDQEKLTEIGGRMLELPVKPGIGRMLIEAEKYGCVDEAVTIAASLSAKNIFVRPKGRETVADGQKQQFTDRSSDFITTLTVLNAYEESGRSHQWARDNFMNYRTLDEILNVRAQLLQILERQNVEISSAGWTATERVYDSEETKSIKDTIGKAVTAGLLDKLAIGHGAHEYESKSGYVWIHPASALFSHFAPKLFASSEVVKTSKPYARNCQAVQFEWIQEIAPHLITEEVTTSSSIVLGITAYKNTYINGMFYKQEGMEPTAEQVRQAEEERLVRREALYGRYSSGLGYSRYSSSLNEIRSPLFGAAREPEPYVEPKPDFIGLSAQAANLRVRVGAVRQGVFELGLLNDQSPIEAIVKRLDAYMEGLDDAEVRDDYQSIVSEVAHQELLLRQILRNKEETERRAAELQEAEEKQRLIQEKEQAAKDWADYEQKVIELKKTYGELPEFGVFEFPIDETSGEPKTFEKNGETYRFDWDSDFIPEAGKSYWGFRNSQTVLGKAKINGIVLLADHQEMPEILKPQEPQKGKKH